MAFAATLFSALFAAGLVILTEACAFPPQACLPEKCAALATSNFDDLLNENSPLLNPSITFNQSDTSSSSDWASAAFKNTLGYFYGIYNPLYNGGKYDPSKGAKSASAPYLNYLRFRDTKGALAKKGTSISNCCNICRTKAGCLIYQFDPYYLTTDNGLDPSDPNYVQYTVFDPSSHGDCYIVTNATNWQKVQQVCANPSDGEYYSSTSKPTFFSGLCNGIVANDPHFVGARGTRYDFNGELDKAFCLITDTRLQVNTLLRGYTDPAGGEVGIRSWMKELGFVWLDSDGLRHTLRLIARSGHEQERGNGFLAAAVVDGSRVAVPSESGSGISQGTMQLAFQGTRKAGHYEVDHFTLRIGDLLDLGISMRVAHPKLQTPDDAEVHFNIALNGIQVTDKVHGVLGQTYRQTQTQQLKAIKYSILSRILGAPVQADGKTGKGFLEGEVSDYITSDVAAADCKFSRMAV